MFDTDEKITIPLALMEDEEQWIMPHLVVLSHYWMYCISTGDLLTSSWIASHELMPTKQFIANNALLTTRSTSCWSLHMWFGKGTPAKAYMWCVQQNEESELLHIRMGIGDSDWADIDILDIGCVRWPQQKKCSTCIAKPAFLTTRTVSTIESTLPLHSSTCVGRCHTLVNPDGFQHKHCCNRVSWVQH
mgnify:CR=1 FL=1